jgi:hypothetical protein
MSEKTGEGGIYPKHGGFEKLLSYQVAELLLDITALRKEAHRTRQPDARPDGTSRA